MVKIKDTHSRTEITWQNPLSLAQKIATHYRDKNWIFLYSGLKGGNSYLALFPQEEIVCEDFTTAKNILENSTNRWFGYTSYELVQDLEKLPKTEKSFIDLPKLWLINFGLIFEFDHKKKKLEAVYKNKDLLKEVMEWVSIPTKSASSIDSPNIIDSNFTDKSYLSAISKIRNLISCGDIYQTNLTRKFFGQFKRSQSQESAFKTFSDLAEISPADYSSFLRLDKNFIISSSPELFFQIKNGKIISRPIKGTTPRGSDIKTDRRNKISLKNSPKERAENLMIVDLVRNDLSRICQAGTVIVKKLFNITSYKTVHHMSSEIHGKLENHSTLDAFQACFPPGSMTGAPKIKAMEIAAKKEGINRGVYSGAIGFIDKKSANFSVVIRTLILRGKKFEFQSGGAITFDSDPQKELEEIFNKSAALTKILGSK